MTATESSAPQNNGTHSETAQQFCNLVRGHFEAGDITPLFSATNTEEVQYWDFASTGSIGNLSPFVGYLWLMGRHRAQKTNHAEPNIYIPKIASEGAGGGTVDTLRAGGYEFLSEPDLVRVLVQTAGGRFFQQQAGLTGYDKPLMKARKEVGLMTSGELVLASILAKKLAIGTTHVVIDVKLGADGKMYPRLGGIPMPEGLSTEEIAREARGETLCDGKAVFVPASQVPTLAKWLAGLLGGGYDENAEFVTVEWKGPYGRSVWVRLMFSNADTPQCRAVGRLLILHQLEQLSSEFCTLPKEMCDWYCKHVPSAVDSAAVAQSTIQTEWKQLKHLLPKLDDKNSDYLTIKTHLAAAMKPGTSHTDSPRGSTSLDSVTVYGEEVPLWVDASLIGRTIERMQAYPLDTLFDSLGGINQHDPAVGIWLHRLPGEVVTENEPVVTAFFRPVDDGARLKRKLIRYLSENVTFVPPESKST